MRIKYRYTFKVREKTKEILEYIYKRNLKHKLDKETYILVIEIFEDDKEWSNLNSLMENNNISSLKSCIYSKREKEDAEWLAIRSKYRWGYPQPDDESDYKNVTYDSANYCSSCGCGLIQKESFKVKNEPNWGKRNFLMLNWVETEIFTNNSVVKQLSKYQLKGLAFTDVLNYKTNIKIENLNQIKIENTLNEGILDIKDTISKKLICSKCNSIKYIMTGKGIAYRQSAFNTRYDMVKSYENFGDGLMCGKLIFISQRLYKILCQNGWDKELSIQPLQLISGI